MNDSSDAALARYRRRFRNQDAVTACADFLLGLVVRRRSALPPARPARILLANAGHLGDAVVSTALFPVIKQAFPGVFLGYLTGSYSRAVIEGHPLLDRTHYLDHWYASKTTGSRVRKIAAYYGRTRPNMARELRSMQYDVAIDLHAWLPNFVPLLWQSGIAHRIGFRRAGFTPLLTQAYAYSYDRRHELAHQLDLLGSWALAPSVLALARPNLPPIPDAARQHVRALMTGLDRYEVLHPTASMPVRDWTLEGWCGLARRVAQRGATAVISGAGARDQSCADAIRAAVPGAVSMVNRLSWPQMMALLEGAERVYSVETSIGHAAAALGRPVFALYGGMADPLHWGPLGSTVVTTPLPCSPCWNKRGCTHRSCLLLTTVDDVEAAVSRSIQ